MDDICSIDGKDGSTSGDDTDRHASPMRTLLSRFCDQFGQEFAPVAVAIGAAADALEAAGQTVATCRILPELRDLRHQVQALNDKVADQQAYVLIFGPLKSGKSTFMNAMCAAYVSEVTCLPAYPCMVYVSHADKPSFTLHRYDAQTETITNGTALRERVEVAHRQLTERIRQVESEGRIFDPSADMPEAIRKVDVKVPAGDLAESGAVLVDTPGLYSRMKFGYDRMTRDFRNAAACAIFVVKTDNLFLEQVFDEFNQLLELFSRIFLVVNLDSSKKDLAPDGTLTPSLEHQDPRRIIEAFERLAMTSPLKQAADDGRLSIYPVDLLGAASRRIRPQNVEHDAAPAGEADFDSMLDDLTEYLNSNDYLRAFIVDSIRRASTLVEELHRLLDDESVVSLEARVEELRQRCDEVRERSTAVKRLNAGRWSELLERLGQTLSRQATQHADDLRLGATRTLEEAVAGWFENSSSLHELVTGEIVPRMSEPRGRFVGGVHAELRRRVTDDRAGLAVSADVERDLTRVSFSLGAIAREALGAVSDKAALPILSDDMISTREMPCRRGFWDWILLRSATSVRTRLLGPANAPEKSILPAIKTRRLGDAARQFMVTAVIERFASVMSAAVETVPGSVFSGYVGAFQSQLGQSLSKLDAQVDAELADVSSSLAAAEAVLAMIERLRADVDAADGAVEKLVSRFGKATPEELIAEADTEIQIPEDADMPDVVVINEGAMNRADDVDDLALATDADDHVMSIQTSDEDELRVRAD